MMGWMLLLVLAQDPSAEEVGQRIEYIAYTVRDVPTPPALRMEAAESLLRLQDRESWVEEIARVVSDRGIPLELRLRGSLLLFEAGDPRARTLARELDEALFDADTDDSAAELARRVRSASPELALHGVDLLSRMKSPAARRELEEILADDGAEPTLRLAAAERLEETGGFASPAAALGALNQVRAADAALAARADRLAGSIRRVREEPRETLEREAPASRPASAPAPTPARASAGRVNLWIAAGTVVALALLVGLRRR
jgi:hypothetical protein